MRLIDADKLIEKLRDFKEWENDDGRPIHTMSEIQRIDRCINFAQTEPTPYDINKVVEELSKAKDEIATENYCRSINEKEKCDGRNCFKCCAEYLIEIVKRGGKE